MYIYNIYSQTTPGRDLRRKRNEQAYRCTDGKKIVSLLNVV